MLAGKVAIVTGAGSGLGQACAVALSREGATVAITELPDRRDKAAETLAMIEAAGGAGSIVDLDVRDLSQITACVGATAGQHGRVDILVNNAGVNIRRNAFDVTEQDWDGVIDVNLKGVFFMAQAVGRQMRDQNPSGGSIINMASIMGLVGYYQRAAYCSSKAGVVNMTRVLAVEWAEHNIRVNAVCPTFVDTPLTRPMFEAQPEFLDDILHRTLLGRLATPEEIAAAVVFLAGPGAAMIHGHALPVDGGWTAM
ncbi:MAG: SDR family oxidoreductase [Thermomicrobiales bacterium]|nr:SDR family oxidoreductase [Thermomicrobiales bacterium]